MSSTNRLFWIMENTSNSYRNEFTNKIKFDYIIIYWIIFKQCI